VKGSPGCIPVIQGCPKTAGNPIDVLTGDKLETVTDYTTAGPTPLVFTRKYRSNTNFSAFRIKEFGDTGPSDNRPDIYTTQTRFGKAWRSNFDAFLVPIGSLSNPSSGARAHLITPEGDELAFRYNSDTTPNWRPAYFDSMTGTWTAPRTDIDVKMTGVTNGIEVQFKSDVIYAFDFNGDLVSIRWPNGYSQTLAYDPEGNNTSVTDSLGRTLTFTYDDDNLLSTMTTPDGKVYTYDYYNPPVPSVGNGTFTTGRSREQVISHVYYPDATPTDLSDNPKITYHYEDTRFRYALTGITDERGIRYATWAYDTQARAIRSTHTGGADDTTIAYDDAGNKVTVTNPLTKQTVFNYSAIQDHKRITSVDGLASANCAASNTSYVYDANGFKSKETDAEGRITQYVNNSRGLPTTIYEGVDPASTSNPPTLLPEGRTTTLSWHATLNQPTQITAPRLTSALSYDSAGRLTNLTQTDTTSHTIPYSTNGQTRSWTYGYCQAGDANCPVGLLKSVNGPLAGAGDTVSYSYDVNGFISTITNEVGHVTTVVTKNASGQPTKIRDANLVDTDLTYDERNRLKTVTIAGAVTTYAYDAAGNVTRITAGDGSYLQYTYNGARRIIRIANNTGEKIDLAYNDNGDVTSRTIKTSANAIVYQQTQVFDELGRLLRQVGAANQTTTFAYDRTDLNVSVTDPRSTLYSYGYDALQRLTSETRNGAVTAYGLDPQDSVATYTDPRSIATTYVRNGFGEVIRETSPDSGITDYVRNALGDVTQMTDGRGVVTAYTYDTAGRMKTKSYPAAAAENIVYSYDATASGNKGKGRLTSLTDQSGATSWAYDERGNRLRESRNIEGEAYPTFYQYDAGDKVSQMTYPSGRIVTYARNALGQVTAVTTKKNATAAVANVATAITWSAMSDLVTGFAYGNGLSFAATYDLDYRISTLKVLNGAANVISLSYSYEDGAGLLANDGVNLTSITDTVTPANSQSLWYTPTGRLQNASGPYGDLTFYMDAVGNRTHELKTGAPTKVLGYPAGNNRLVSETTGGTLTRSFTYDGAGNMLTGLPAGSTYSLAYNKRNRPSTLRQNGTAIATYLFNAQEQLVSRSVTQPTASTTHYIYDTQGHLIAEATGTSASTAVITREYLWLDGMPIAVIDGVNTASPVTSYVHTDHLTRPIRITNAAKATTWSAQWLPHGGAHVTTGTATQNLRFPGQYFLIEQGLAYNWHRFYDATTGRYTQPDPYGVRPMIDHRTGLAESYDYRAPGFHDGPSKYAYAKNSPVMYTDPTGQFVMPGTEELFDYFWKGPSACPAPDDALTFPPLQMSKPGRWECSGTCNVYPVVPGANCPARVYGYGTGSSEREAYLAMQADANAKVPRGCQKRHCNPRCKRR
jgi:RHS repeat-associated protein